MPNIRLPLQVKDLTGDIQTLSGYVVALRAYPFLTNTITGEEATNALGFYDFEDVVVNIAYQMWAGTSLQTMTRVHSFSNDDGRVIFGVDDSFLLNAGDGTNNQIPTNYQSTGIVWKSLQTLADEVGLTFGEYYYLRAVFSQDNAVSSGKLRISLSATSTNMFSAYSLANSSKTSTGIYKTKITGLNPVLTATYYQKWDNNRKFPVYNGTTLQGYFHFGVNIALSDFDFQDGYIISHTYGPDGTTLTDNILSESYTFEIRAYELT